MQKLSLPTITAKYASTEALNSAFDAIEAAIENTLSRDGTTPNEMEADLDLNNNNIINSGVVYTDRLVLGGIEVESASGVSEAVSTIIPFDYVATAGQTTFSTAPYTPSADSVIVSVNGLVLPSTDISVSTTNIVIPATMLNDEVVIKLFRRDVTDVTATATNTPYTPSFTGAVGRLIADKLDEVVSVKDFGAVGDGVTDDSAAIQLAIDYAESLVAATEYDGAGADVFFPPGNYLCDTGLVISSDGISLFGASPMSTRIFTTGGIDLITVGDATDTVNTFEVHFTNLFFDCTDRENTDTVGIHAYRTFFSTVTNCVFQGFYESIVGERANRWTFHKVTTTQDRDVSAALSSFRFKGLASGSGGGLHMTDCELGGGGSLMPSVTAHLYLETCDGLYASNIHTRDCGQAVLVAPTGAADKNVVDSLFFTNCYFDENYDYNVRLTGTVASGGRYQFIHFSNCYFRGSGGTSTNCVLVDITSSGFTGKIKSIQFTGGSMRQAEQTAMVVRGSGSGFAEVYGLQVNGVHIEDNNYGAATSISGINLECETAVVTNCVFGEDFAASTQVVRLNTSLLNSNAPSFIVSNNDFSKANSTGIPVTYTLSASGASFILTDNIFSGAGKVLNQQFKTTTTNATPTSPFTWAIPSGTSGFIEVEVAGTTSTGTSVAVYTFSAGFRRSGAGSSLSSGTTNFTAGLAWNPDALASPPTATLATNTLTVTVTGVAATTINWSVNVKLISAR
jgi:hypothetical protein